MSTLILTKKRPAPSFTDFNISQIPDAYFTDWITETFLEPTSKLYNFEHDHLSTAQIGVLWSAVENSRHGKRIVAQAEFAPAIGGTQGKWAKARAQSQLFAWFGREIDFLLTFDAHFFHDANDETFCLVVEHELYHCGQAMRDGFPAFKRDGSPKFAIRGHDVEEHVGVIRRYGMRASPQAYEIGELVRAAQSKPEIAPADIDFACGNCIK